MASVYAVMYDKLKMELIEYIVIYFIVTASTTTFITGMEEMAAANPNCYAVFGIMTLKLFFSPRAQLLYISCLKYMIFQSKIVETIGAA